MRGSLLKRKPGSSVSKGMPQYADFLTPSASLATIKPTPSFFGLVGQSKARSELAAQLQNCNVSAVETGSSHLQTAHRVEEAGKRLDDYDIVKELGQGASGQVFLVTLKADGSSWVIKQVPLLGNARSAAPSSDRHGAMARMERDNVLREVPRPRPLPELR
jgi:hypothetical protein